MHWSTWQTVAALLTPATVFAVLLVLHIVLPARRVDGYAYICPCLYPVALWGTADLPAPEIDASWNPLWLGGSLAIFLIGWVIARGANLQKYTFKRFPERAFLVFVKPATVTDGERKILCSVWAWMYFVYLTVFFVIRERIDDRRCAGKYGELWTQYQAKVRYRLVPGIY